MSTRRTIDANGNLVAVDDGAPSSGGGETEPMLSLSALQSMQTVDVFGFNVPARQFYIGLAVLVIFFRLKGGA